MPTSTLAPVVHDDPNALASLFEHAFFRSWLHAGLYQRKSDALLHQGAKTGRRLCDHVISMGRTLILIDVHQGVFDSHDDLAQEWGRFRKMALPNSRRRLAELEQQLHQQAALYWDDACQERVVVEPEHIYKLCITAAFERNDQQYSAILHSYGSDFYRESFVQDEEDNPLLVYSLGDFSAVVGQLESFPDFLDFLAQHHQTVQTDRQEYSSELELLEQHIATGRPFLQGWALEKQWLADGLKQHRSLLLGQALTQPPEVFAQLHDRSLLWRQLIVRYAWHAVDSAPHERDERMSLLEILADESLLSQALLSEAMVHQAAFAAAKADDGYVVHLRSSTHARRHYVLFFYAQSVGHRYSRDQMVSQLPTLAEQINAQEQAPLLDDVLVLGIASQHGQFVSADIAHLVGHVVQPTRVHAIQSGEHRAVNRGARRDGAVGRTDPCPCQSGRRYKHCCGRS